MKRVILLVIFALPALGIWAESRIFILADITSGPKPVFTFIGKGNDKMEMKMEQNLQILVTSRTGKFRVLKDNVPFKYKDDTPMILDLVEGHGYFLRRNQEFRTWEVSDITATLPTKSVTAVITADPGAPASLEYFTIGPTQVTGITFKKPNFYFEAKFLGLENGPYSVFAEDFNRKRFAPVDDFGDPVAHTLVSGIYNIRITSGPEFVSVTEVPIITAP